MQVTPTDRGPLARLRASVVITSYNHARFLRECIDSVLAQTYADIQIVVVDDGSTDDSRAVLDEYRGRVEAILQENGGQGAATTTGFDRVTGDVVLFLDSDDFLKPHAIEAVVAAWRDGDAKLQFRLACVDEDSQPLGPLLPRLLHEGDVRPIIRKFGRYQFSMSSGSVYASAAVRKVMPIDAAQWRAATDYYLSCTCAFLGNVRLVPESLGYYRIHRKRADSENYLRGNVDASGLEQFLRSRRQMGYLIASLKRLGFVDENATFREPPHLAEIHLMLAKTMSAYDAQKWGSVFRVFRQALVAFSIWPGWRPTVRLVLLAWIVAVAVTPAGLSFRLYAWKQCSWTMPAMLRRCAEWLFRQKNAGAP